MAKYILFFFLAVFIGNAAGSIIEKKQNIKLTCLQAAEDDPDSDDISDSGDQKKFQNDRDAQSLDDDILHEHHFNLFFEHSSPIKYIMSSPPLADRIMRNVFLPPRA